MKQKVRGKGRGQELLLGRIGDGHGQSGLNGHGQKCRVHLNPLRQAEGNIGQAHHRGETILSAVTDGFQRFPRGLRVGSDRGYQAVHNDVLFCEAEGRSAFPDLFNDILLLLKASRKSRVGKRKKNEHGAVFFRQGNQLFKFFRLQRDGIDQRPARIPAERRFQNVDVAGIQGQGKLCRLRHLIDGTKHQRLFIHAAHSHVHIQNGRAGFLLIFGELHRHIKAALPQLGLKLFLAGGVDPLSDHQKRIGKPEGNGFSFRGEIPDSLRSPVGQSGLSSLHRFGKLPDMRRRGSAAAAEDYGSRRIYRFHFPRKGRSVHVVNRFARAVQRRKSGVGLGDDGNAGDRRHPADDLCHRVRAGGAVGAHRVRSKAFQNHRGRLRIGSEKASAILFKGHRDHDGKIRTGFLRGDQRGPAFLQAHHGLHHQKIRAGFREETDLLLIDLHQLLKIHFPDRGELLPCHGQISGHQRVRPGRLPGSLHQRVVQLPDPPFQPVFGQLDPVGGEGGRIQDVRSRLHIFPLQTDQHIRMSGDPFLRADSCGHSGGHQIGAGRSVQQDNPLFYHIISEFFSGHFILHA